MINLDPKALESLAQEMRQFEERLTRILGFEVHISITSLKPPQANNSHKLMVDAYIKLVKEVVCRENNITVRQLCSPGRDGGKPELRWMCFQIIKDAFPSIALSRIGAAFGGRDHTTVSHGLCRIQELLKEEIEIFNQYLTLKNIINNGKTQNQGFTLSGNSGDDSQQNESPSGLEQLATGTFSGGGAIQEGGRG